MLSSSATWYSTDATGWPAVNFGEEQPALWGSIGTGQRSHFLVKILIRQIDAEPGRIVAEILANVLKGFAVVGGEGA